MRDCTVSGKSMDTLLCECQLSPYEWAGKVGHLTILIFIIELSFEVKDWKKEVTEVSPQCKFHCIID